jgi:hypothetical protein
MPAGRPWVGCGERGASRCVPAIAGGSDIDRYLSGVWGSSGSDVLAVGGGGTVLHFLVTLEALTRLYLLVVMRSW